MVRRFGRWLQGVIRIFGLWLRGVVRFFRDRSRPANWLTRTITTVIGVIAVCQGCQIWVGGRIRWTGPSYHVLRQIPYTPYSMAAAVALFGTVVLVGMLLGVWIVKMTGLALLSAWSTTFAIGQLAAMQIQATAGSTGFWTYAGIALVVPLMGFVRDERVAIRPRLAALRRHRRHTRRVARAPRVGV